MSTTKKGGGPSAEDATLSKLAEEILASCREALIAAGDLSPDQAGRLVDIAMGAKKPKAADLLAILEEEGELA